MSHFKPLTVAEIPGVVKMMQDFYAIDGYPMDAVKSSELFADFLSDENLGKCWLIYDENVIVGYLILTFAFSFEYGGKIAFLDELYLAKTARGKGIGKTAVAFLKAEAAKLSLKLLYLEVEHHNYNAQKLYLAAGFEPHGRNLMKYKIE